MDVRVISIGALSAHPLWGEREPVRTGHATTTLVRTERASVLVDPGLPAPALVARLHERAGVTPSEISHVFLTSFQPECRLGIEAFEHAAWLIAEREREAVGVPLAHGLARLEGTRQAAEAAGQTLDPDQQNALRVLQHDIAILQRCQPAPDSIAPCVDLFPMPGVTPGLTGLLIAEPSRTTLICGDAVPTSDHLAEGMVLPDCHDRELARESLAEAIEIADVLILGRDNVVLHPTKRRM